MFTHVLSQTVQWVFGGWKIICLWQKREKKIMFKTPTQRQEQKVNNVHLADKQVMNFQK